MKSFLGVTLGALILAAPAMAFAGANGGGGGRAGVVVPPPTAAVSDAPTRHSNLSFARAGTTPGANSGAVAQEITAISQALSGGNVAPFTSPSLLANQRGGGH